MPHLILAFDPSTSIVLHSQAEAAEELPFPVAALLCSLRTYAQQIGTGWLLEDIEMEDCSLVYHKGLTGLLWMVITSNRLLDPGHVRNLLHVRTGQNAPWWGNSSRVALCTEVADAVVLMLLGPALLEAGHAVAKRQFKGIARLLDHLLQPNLQLFCPLATLLLPHQTMLQPSPAAAHLPCLLEQVCTAASASGPREEEQKTVARAALLHDGWYCCATPDWQSMDSLQLLALQLIATAAAKDRIEAVVDKRSWQQAQYGQLTIHLPSWGADTQLCTQLLWYTLQPGLQLCLLTSSSNYQLQQFEQSTQQLLANLKPGMLEVQSLMLQPPLLAVAIRHSASCWATCNTSKRFYDCSSFVQLARTLPQKADESVLLHTANNTVAILPIGSSTVYVKAEGALGLEQMQELININIPSVVL